jgi:hypothetical protein
MIAQRQHAETAALTIVGLACALASSAAFWLHMLGLVPMPFFINFVGRPSIVLMLIVGLFAWHRQFLFWKRFRAGLVGGAIALMAYDGIRFAIYSSHLLDFYPFQTHRVFGYLITGQPPGTDAAAFAGWLYHFWNGFSFAIIYALIAGPARWYWGLAWAMLLEAAMLLTYPTLLDIKMNAAFVGISLIGHTAYGIALGLAVSHLVQQGE